MALLPGVPQIIVEVAFTNNPLDLSPTWTDISADVIGFIPTNPMGRQHQLNRVQPTSYTVTLNDRHGKYTSTNSSSPYYHSPSTGTGMVPGKPMRIRAIWSSVTYAVARGFVDKWVAVPTDALNQTATVQFTDVFKLLNNTYLNNPALYPGTVLALLPDDYLRLNDAAPPRLGSSNPADYGSTAGPVAYLATGLVLYDPATSLDLSNGSSGPSGFITAPGGTYPSGAAMTYCGTFTAKPIGGSTPGPTGTTQTILQLLQSTTATVTGEALQITPSGQLVLTRGSFNFPDSRGLTTDIDGPVGMTDGNPHWWALKLTSPSGSTCTMTLYVDGVSYGSTTNALLPAANPNPLIFGGLTWNFASAVGTLPAFTGSMQDIAIWHSAVSGASLINLFTVGSYLQNVELTGTRMAKALIVAGYGSFPQSLAAGTILCDGETAAGIQTTSGVVPAGQQIATNPVLTAITQSLVGDYLLTVNDTENGLLYQDEAGAIQFKDRHYPQLNPTTTASQATIGDNAAATYHYDVTGFAQPQDDQDLWPMAQVQRSNGVIQVSTDSAAELAVGSRTYQLSGLLNRYDFDSLALAQWITYLYAWPLPRTSAVLLSSATNAGANLPKMLGLKLWDSVTLQRQGPGEAAQSIFECIESIGHTWDSPGSKFTTKWVLSPFEVSAKANAVLLLDNATRGKLDSTNVLGG